MPHVTELWKLCIWTHRPKVCQSLPAKSSKRIKLLCTGPFKKIHMKTNVFFLRIFSRFLKNNDVMLILKNKQSTRRLSFLLSVHPSNLLYHVRDTWTFHLYVHISRADCYLSEGLSIALRDLSSLLKLLILIWLLLIKRFKKPHIPHNAFLDCDSEATKPCDWNEIWNARLVMASANQRHGLMSICFLPAAVLDTFPNMHDATQAS